MLQNLRPIEIILLIAIVLLLFGAKKLPEAARGIGQSLKIFRKEIRGEESQEAGAHTSVDQAEPDAAPVAGEATAVAGAPVGDTSR